TASRGIVTVARRARVPIVPIGFATSRRRVLRSWDRSHLALPCGRGIFVWGEPIEIAAGLDPAGLERARFEVESRMNDMAGEADRRVGHQNCPSPALREREEPTPPMAFGAWEGEGLTDRPSPFRERSPAAALSRNA